MQRLAGEAEGYPAQEGEAGLVSRDLASLVCRGVLACISGPQARAFEAKESKEDPCVPYWGRRSGCKFCCTMSCEGLHLGRLVMHSLVCALANLEAC